MHWKLEITSTEKSVLSRGNVIFILQMYLITIEQLFLFVEQLVVCLPIVDF